jgi:hypothetical protein
MDTVGPASQTPRSLIPYIVRLGTNTDTQPDTHTLSVGSTLGEVPSLNLPETVVSNQLANPLMHAVVSAYLEDKSSIPIDPPVVSLKY